METSSVQLRVPSGAPALSRVGLNAARALVDWWQLAGQTALVAETARPWIDSRRPEASGDGTPTPAPAASVASVVPAARAASAAAAMPDDVAQLALLESHAALVAHVAATSPGAPFLDGEGRRGLMILGEAPSVEDLHTGRPFSGPAGQLLDRMLAAIGLSRADVFITLLAPRKRVPGPPSPADVARDLALTLRHIELADVSRLLLLGGIPAQVLTGSGAPISRLRGAPLTVAAGARSLPALATFNPAYLLRRPSEKALAWRDLIALSRGLSA